MKISPSKLISLLFFVFSGYYLYTAYQIQVFAFDENAPFNAKTFPIYLGFAGLVFSALYIILPEANPTNVDLKVLDYKKTIGLVILMILYGLTILKSWIFSFNFNFFSCLLHNFRRKKMDLDIHFIFPFRCNIYVSPSWIIKYLST